MLFAVVQTYGVVVCAAVVDAWWAWLVAFVWMGRGHALLNILGHEAAHRLLFSDRRVNDGVGRWLLGYPTLLPFYAYRRAHFAHHRDELGPNEPDTELYAGYPITAASWRRKLRRDATGESAAKNIRLLLTAARKGAPEGCRSPACSSSSPASPSAPSVRSPTWCGSARGARSGRCPTGYGRSPSTEGWSVPAIAGARPTSSVSRRLARLCFVPYNTGWHLAHHVDMGVPWRNLPRLHAELVAAGWITPTSSTRPTEPSGGRAPRADRQRQEWGRARRGRPR